MLIKINKIKKFGREPQCLKRDSIGGNGITTSDKSRLAKLYYLNEILETINSKNYKKKTFVKEFAMRNYRIDKDVVDFCFNNIDKKYWFYPNCSDYIFYVIKYSKIGKPVTKTIIIEKLEKLLILN